MWTYKGVQITVDQNGKFRARIADLEINAASRDEAERLISAEISSKDKPKVALKVLGFLSKAAGRHAEANPIKIASAVLIGVNRTSRDLMFEGVPKGYEFEHVVADTPGNKKHLHEYLELRLAWRRMEEDHNSRLVGAKLGFGRIDAVEYEKTLKNLTDSHTTSVEVSNA
jgi:DNA polymerase III delta prime subunit